MSSGFPPPILATIPSNGIIPVTGNLLNQAYTVVNLNFREPYAESWNLALQRSLPGKLVLEMAYGGNHGVALPTVFNLNAALASGVRQRGRALFPTTGSTGDEAPDPRGTSYSYYALQIT